VADFSRNRAARVLALVLLVAGTAAAHARIRSEELLESDERWVPNPELARVASIGFQNVVSDYHWLQAVQVVGSSRSDPSVHGPLLGRLIDVVTTLDPWVDHPYRFAAVWMTESLASIRKANALLERGIRYHPDDWRDPYYLGFNHFFYLQENEAAADALENASKKESSPAYLPLLVARLRAGGDGLETSAALLAGLVGESADPYAKAEYEKALDEVETERRARALDRARAEFQRRRGRDIARVEELVEGRDAVLKELPPELHGWEWVIEPGPGRIVSSWYGRRYEPLVQASVRDELGRKERVKPPPMQEEP